MRFCCPASLSRVYTVLFARLLAAHPQEFGVHPRGSGVDAAPTQLLVEKSMVQMRELHDGYAGERPLFLDGQSCQRPLFCEIAGIATLIIHGVVSLLGDQLGAALSRAGDLVGHRC